MGLPWSYGEEVPPRTEEERLRVTRCPPVGSCDYLLLGEAVFVARTHYDEVSVPCVRFPCPYCAQGGWPSRLEGFIAAVVMSPREKVVLALSEFVLYQMAQIAEENDGLRGIVVSLRRGARRAHAPVYATYVRSLRDSITKPPPDIHPVLARVWGLPNLTDVRRTDVVPDGLGPHGAQARRQKKEGGAQ